MNIFFDLDGTILDVSKKYYAVYLISSKNIPGVKIPFNTYWQAKRKKIAEDKILNLSPFLKTFKEYQKKRIANLENRQILDLDKPFKWVNKTLEKLSKNNLLYLMTLRRNRNNLKYQLKKLDLNRFFTLILNVSPTVNPVGSKEKLIQKIHFTKKGIWIGDTEADILLAKKVGLISVAVYSGIRERRYLKNFNPDYLVKDASKILTIDVFRSFKINS